MKLYLLPFDHRHSFEELINAKDHPSKDEVDKIKDYKQMIFLAFKKALQQGVSKRDAGILVDEQYGREILLAARKNQLITCYTLEKSGQQEFHFDKSDWKKKLKFFRPTYAKVLIRYNPVNKALNKRQAKKLKQLGDYLRKVKIKFLLEVLVPATEKQRISAYETKLRPILTKMSIKELQKAGVKPDIWKLEGVDKLKDLLSISRQVKEDSEARIVILGRGESRAKAEHWLKIGAKVPVVVGFAVGRTVFQQPLMDYQNKKTTKQQTIKAIMNNYLHFVKLFEKVKNESKN